MINKALATRIHRYTSERLKLAQKQNRTDDMNYYRGYLAAIDQLILKHEREVQHEQKPKF